MCTTHSLLKTYEARATRLIPALASRAQGENGGDAGDSLSWRTTDHASSLHTVAGNMATSDSVWLGSRAVSSSDLHCMYISNFPSCLGVRHELHVMANESVIRNTNLVRVGRKAFLRQKRRGSTPHVTRIGQRERHNNKAVSVERHSCAVQSNYTIFFR